jgi:hypothetical protein
MVDAIDEEGVARVQDDKGNSRDGLPPVEQVGEDERADDTDGHALPGDLGSEA